MDDYHEMEKVKTYPTGVTEWHCATCGLHTVMQAKPFKKIVLVKGDDYALHRGGPINMQNTTVKKAPDLGSGSTH